MRLLILGVSALSLSACSVGGVGFGSGGHGSYETSPSVGYGSWQSGHEVGYGQASGYNQASGYGYAQTTCGGSVPAPHYGSNCGAPAYVPPAAPCYQPIQTPCAAAQPQAVTYGYQPTAMTPPAHYPSGYPSMPTPPVTPSCGHNPCDSGYSVSPYSYSGEHHNTASYGVQTPAPHAYGTNSGSSALGHYGYQQAPRSRSGHFYGTVGAVWYDIDRPYAGVQGRLGYQATSILGAEIEGSIGVINEVSPFNQDVGGGTILSGEFKDGVDYSAAAFATARLPLSRNISTHARVGYHTTRTFADVDFENNPDQETTTTMDGLAYGAGIQMDVTPVDAVRFDVTRYSGDTQDNDAVSVAYLRRF